MGLHIRELPPLRLNHTLETPSGKTYRWASDAANPEHTPSGVKLSSTMPGGDDQWEGTLARKPSRDYADLEELTRITSRGVGGEIAGMFRLETSPRVSGDQLAITPGAVGYQAALDDDQSVRAIFVDADMTRWGDMPLNRKIDLASGALAVSFGDFSFTADAGGLVCALPNQALGALTDAEAWYTAPAGVNLAKVQFIGAVTSFPAGWTKQFFTSSDGHTAQELYAEALAGALERVPLSPARRYIAQQVFSNGTAATPASGANVRFSALAVYADHGLTLYAITGGTDGVLASDVIAYALGKWCPELLFSTGGDGTIQPSLFVIPHLIFPDMTTVSDIVKQSTRFELQDWAVWGTEAGPTFYMNARGARGRTWLLRVGPSGLDETGPQIDRLYNSVVVGYTDTGGISRTVGPIGSGCDTEDSSLTDADPLNPVNQAGITRRALVNMNGVATSTGAIKIGAEWLAYQKEASTAGSAKAVGYATDDRGIVWPAWMVKAGDNAKFVDANDPSPRRIVSAEYTDDDKTCSISLDSPPDSMGALLERMNVELVPIGQGS